MKFISSTNNDVTTFFCLVFILELFRTWRIISIKTRAYLVSRHAIEKQSAKAWLELERCCSILKMGEVFSTTMTNTGFFLITMIKRAWNNICVYVYYTWVYRWIYVHLYMYVHWHNWSDNKTKSTFFSKMIQHNWRGIVTLLVIILNVF